MVEAKGWLYTCGEGCTHQETPHDVIVFSCKHAPSETAASVATTGRSEGHQSMEGWGLHLTTDVTSVVIGTVIPGLVHWALLVFIGWQRWLCSSASDSRERNHQRLSVL